MSKSLTLCITVFNEEENLPGLFEDIDNALSSFPELSLVFAENGSSDTSRQLLLEFASENASKVEVVCIEQNVGYGGGLATAAGHAKTEYLCFFSADRQYSADDLIQLITRFEQLKISGLASFVVKGNRVVRSDSWSGRVVSAVYSWLSGHLLGIVSKDINALPKIFPKSYIRQLGPYLSSQFFLDAQILSIAGINGDQIIEVGVQFSERANGISSWAGKRVRTYLTTLVTLIKFRRILKANIISRSK